MSKIGEIQVTLRGMKETQQAASAIAKCFNRCRESFENLAHELGEVLAEMDKADDDEDTELE